MSGEEKGGKSGPANLPISAIFLFDALVSPERRRALISRVLNEYSALPVGVRNALRSAVNDEVVPTSGGFRKGQAGRALDRSSFLLQEPLFQSVTASDILAGAVLQCWAESQPSLREAVERHLTGRGLTTPGPDLHDRLFRGQWLPNQWDAERDSFSLTYADDFDPEDVALMLCYVSGNFPPLPHHDTGDSGELTLDDTLSAALSSLQKLPPTAPDWERRIPDFVASVSRIIEEKAAQLRWHEEFDAVLQGIRGDFPSLLEFFEQDTQYWLAARVSQEVDAGAALRLAAKLQSQLAEYQPIHDRAPNISEERERASQRDSLQPSILATLQQIAAMMTGEVPAQPPAARLTDTATSPSTHGTSQPPAPTTPGLIATSPREPKGEEKPAAPHSIPSSINSAPKEASPLETRPTPGSTSVATAEPPTQSSPDLLALRSENVQLRDGTDALRSENQDLKDEVEALKTELFSTQEREDSWRLAYRSAMDGSLEEVGVAPPVVESVFDAVEIAKGRFRQELVFAPNSESSIEDNPFTDPLRVWEALEWLGTTYYASRMGRLRVTDFDQSIKEACGWWYKGDQGETTVSRYEKSYTTRFNGRRYTLLEHIGKGTTFDARYTIRIAFDWDREKRQVVIGYIGRHQQTDAS